MQHEETLNDLANVRKCLLEYVTHTVFFTPEFENVLKAFAFIDANIARLKAAQTLEKSDK